ncbi:MAG: Uncharacterized MFS-type transporter YxiO, partial [uncultured Gemmatimonadaceae bacterium]
DLHRRAVRSRHHRARAAGAHRGARAAGAEPPRAARLGDVRLGELRLSHHGHGRGLPDLLLVGGLGRRVARGRDVPVRRGHHAGARRDRARRAAPRRAGRRGADQEAAARAVHGGGRGGDGGDVLHRPRRVAVRRDAVRDREHRGERQLRLLRRLPAARGAPRRGRPRLHGGVRAGLRGGRAAARAQPGLDPAARLVRPAQRPEPHARRGDAPRAAGLRVGGRVVGAVRDPLLPARAGAAGARGRRRAAGRRQAARADVPRAARLPQRAAHARGLPRVQRRHRHDHPHGHHLRHRDRDRARGADHGGDARAVRGDPVRLRVRRAGAAHHRQARHLHRPRGLHGDLGDRLLHAHRHALLRALRARGDGAGGDAG